MTVSRILELSSIIATNTQKIDAFLTFHGHPHPTFDVDGPLELNLSDHLRSCQDSVLDATMELNSLMLGPVGTILQLSQVF